EPGHCKVEAVPEQVHGAGLAVEPSAEFLEYRVRPVEDSAKSCNGLAIPGRVPHVLSKWRGHGNTERHFPDFNIDAKFTEDRVDARIEVPDRQSSAEPERLGPAVGGPHDQGMIDEVDGDVERRVAMVEATCR